jgi:dihydrofolate synthase/folylpolyglutamate synthase
MRFVEAVLALDGALRFGINPSLDGIRALCAELGEPQLAYRCVQVTGTNGKSSVTRMVAAILAAHGERAGAYTSPHMVSYTERIEIDGRQVSENEFARGIEAALGAAERAGGEYTEFELLTAGALWLLRERGVAFAVLEVGMGGRWDATSVVVPAVAVVTGVALDHTERLGDTVEQIAADKAHVIKRGSVAVLGPGTAAVRAIFESRAEQVGAKVVTVGEGDVHFSVLWWAQKPGGDTALRVIARGCDFGEVGVTAPAYQAPNVATAIAAAQAALGGAVDVETTRSALARMTFPGRFELVLREPPIVLDGAHNPEAAGVLATAIAQAWPDPEARPVAVIGILADKDAEGIVRALAPVVRGFVCTASASPRALPAEALADLVERVTGARPPVRAYLPSAVEEGRRLGRAAGAVVTGSLYTVGEARALLVPTR